MKDIPLLMILVLFLTACSVHSPEATMETTIPSVSTEPETWPAAATEPTVKPEPPLFSALIQPRDQDIVRIKDYIPGVVVELKYSGSQNFTGQAIYGFEDAFLRYGTVMKLKAVAEELEAQGLYLKIWDGFRPVSAQFKLWEICPDDTYVANPNLGYSNHSRGFAVDLTLVDSQGRELEMPTEFDDFSTRADRDYADCDAVPAENARMLEAVMQKHGFRGYWGEWWHFNDTQKYEVETCFDPGAVSRRITAEEAPLLECVPDPAQEILRIPAGESVTLLGFDGDFALVEYWGYRGYVRGDTLIPGE